MGAKLIISLDTTPEKAKTIVKYAKEFNFNLFKVGHLLFDTHPAIIEYITKLNCDVLLDLKFHDIPTVIYSAVKGILKKYKIWGFTLHILGGKTMLSMVKNVAYEFNPRPKLFGVTILTSLSQKDLEMLGFKTNIKNTVLTLAKIAKNVGLDGIVCSPQEVNEVKTIFKNKLLTLVPGVTLTNNKNVDQKRTSSIEKIINIADYIVVGRNIYESKDVRKTLKNLSILFHN